MFAIKTCHFNNTSADAMTTPIQHFIATHSPKLLLGFATADTIKLLGKKNCPVHLPHNSLIISSCLGSANETTLSLNGQSISLFSISDPTGHYGVAHCDATTELRAHASKTVLQAIKNAGQIAIAPKMVWCFQVPGNEEQVINGIQDVIGSRIPIFGGTCADNDLLGQWCFSNSKDVFPHGFIIAVLYPSVDTLNFYSTGYDKTNNSGTVTAVEGRILKEIDNQPALSVYNLWRKNAGFSMLSHGNILAESTMTPLARSLSSDDDIPRLLLSHPAVAHQDHLELFSNLFVGDTIYLACGSPEQLIKRGDMVVSSLVKLADLHSIKTIKGAIIVFCGGCMLSIQNAMHQVKQAIALQLPNTPFIIGFTFGELGTFSDSTSKHGNLMISCQIFGDTQ